jgi:hypothetical protein
MKFLISAAFTFLFAQAAFGQTQAEVIVPSTFLRKSPSPSAEKVLSLNHGEKLMMEKAQDTNGWLVLRLDDGRQGQRLDQRQYDPHVGRKSQTRRRRSAENEVNRSAAAGRTSG